MSKKMGRPKLPRGAAKGVQIGVRFTPTQDQKIDDAILRSGSVLNKTEWVRDAALEKAKLWQERPALDHNMFWGNLPYPEDELNRQKIEFKVLIKWDADNPTTVTSGTGRLEIREANGKYHVKIISRVSPLEEKVLDLTSDQAMLIKRQPEGSRCQFSLKGV